MNADMVAVPSSLSGRRRLGEGERLFVASQWTLMWLHFRRHRLAVVGLAVVSLMYAVALFCGFFAPYERVTRWREYIHMPPTSVHLHDGERLSRPFVYGVTVGRDLERMARVFEEDRSVKYPIRLFVRGEKYKLAGLFDADIHLFGVDEGGIVSLMGTDDLGRDVFSRTIWGSAISLSVGLVGVLISFFLGAILGGVSGYYGGVIDVIIQRVIEFLMSVPTIPLWMGLAAAVPTDWPPLRVYFIITLILSLRGWTHLARIVRSKLLEVRGEDYIMAASLAGASDWQIITRHLLPSTLSYLIVHMTLAIPTMILGETSLSFLGLGLRDPVVSWGVLLQKAQKVSAVVSFPWLLWPASAVVVFVLAFNFMGDGMRDAADPYKS